MVIRDLEAIENPLLVSKVEVGLHTSPPQPRNVGEAGESQNHDAQDVASHSAAGAVGEDHIGAIGTSERALSARPDAGTNYSKTYDIV